ncbi:MAG: LON peptidase substrate-binding domain-containing protein [Wenzhouxiangellaceae bacterium]|nr:LON peptidase substrate-binding domain-containing protein [Wenzhouxiangellaceae bacterium]MBS3747694.1 LON peptidase substrate-binding domain-containing protein [Wenzhouxiangellaceae bacterium]MBS3824151.1 LON peptidase substrate-binding domain-containing protein [Wenzhouxiangellaceae bacterium]
MNATGSFGSDPASARALRTESLPLFPLPLVLFPHARTQLRIFESRYLEMTRECSAGGTGFGVVHFSPADENKPARHAAVGTEALIEDFSTLDDGLLGLEVRGHRRFRIRSTRARDDGLIVGEVEWLPAEPRQQVQPEHAVLQNMLRELLQHQAFADVIDADPDDASALGMALASVLPLETASAQELLAVTDPHDRLRALCTLLEQAPEDQTDD